MQQVVTCGRNFRVMRTTPSATLTSPAAATGEYDDQAVPMPSDHPDVQAGVIRDAVDVVGTVFHRRREGTYPDAPNAVRIQASRPLTDQEMQRMAQLVGYQYAAEVRGDPFSDPLRDSPFSFIIAADTTKTRSDDLGAALERFEAGLDHIVQAGSPVRTTNRAGEGTKGTRLVEGFNEAGLTFELFYDDV